MGPRKGDLEQHSFGWRVMLPLPCGGSQSTPLGGREMLGALKALVLIGRVWQTPLRLYFNYSLGPYGIREEEGENAQRGRWAGSVWDS
jgi:hypothetical protein